jgi:hypothetical protein
MEMWEAIVELTGGPAVALALIAATVGTVILLMVRRRITLPAWLPGKGAERSVSPRPLSHVKAEYGRRSGAPSGSEDQPIERSPASATESRGELLCPRELTERIDRMAARVKTRSASNRA